jgi:hypothetical protein
MSFNSDCFSWGKLPLFIFRNLLGQDDEAPIAQCFGLDRPPYRNWLIEKANVDSDYFDLVR